MWTILTELELYLNLQSISLEGMRFYPDSLNSYITLNVVKNQLICKSQNEKHIDFRMMSHKGIENQLVMLYSKKSVTYKVTLCLTFI